jgi:hypothetical protein
MMHFDANYQDIDGLILDSPYTTLKDLTSDLYPWRPAFLLKLNLSNLEVKKSAIDYNPRWKSYLIIFME